LKNEKAAKENIVHLWLAEPDHYHAPDSEPSRKLIDGAAFAGCSAVKFRKRIPGNSAFPSPNGMLSGILHGEE